MALYDDHRANVGAQEAQWLTLFTEPADHPKRRRIDLNEEPRGVLRRQQFLRFHFKLHKAIPFFSIDASSIYPQMNKTGWKLDLSNAFIPHIVSHYTSNVAGIGKVQES
ncbi:hypothetical protein Pyn_31541 [Prunus yedoensis var. nudiflora]|uniref:Uncharacterized protein n=1 Tax=Prunus yedoensis var. nudiflora TaxID=2094558 RepID=A0A314XZ92_PRUYE|nr:hypothetical protein Pyn_31541 [Prunus yedoensis var. nudiflora]